MDGPDVSVHLHGPVRCQGTFRNLSRGILHNLCRDILIGLCGSDLRLRIFLDRPSLESPKTGFQKVADYFPSDSDRQIRRRQQFRRGSARRDGYLRDLRKILASSNNRAAFLSTGA